MLQNVNVLLMGASQGLHGGSQSGRLFASVPGRGRCSGFVAFALTMGREGEVTPVGTNGQRPWMFCAPKDSDLGFLLPALPMGSGRNPWLSDYFYLALFFLNHTSNHRGCSLQTPDGRDPSFSGKASGTWAACRGKTLLSCFRGQSYCLIFGGYCYFEENERTKITFFERGLDAAINCRALNRAPVRAY